MTAENKDEGLKGEGGNEGKDEPFLGTWKTKGDAAEGLKNLQTKLSEQGNETGNLKARLDEAGTLMQEMSVKLEASEKASTEKASDLNASNIKSEQVKINQQIADLDPVDDDYSAKLTKLMTKSNSIAAQSQHEMTLQAATDAFKSELDERDVQSAHKKFYDANPEFNTPEIKQKIQEYIANDETGMSDPLVAFREIQRDDAMAKATELETQNAELSERLNLKKGAGETGTVILKGHADQMKSQQKTTGAERNQGMQGVLDSLRTS